MHLCKTRLLCRGKQIALVKVHHRAGVGLGACVDGNYFADEVHDRCDSVSAEAVQRLRVCEAVDRFKDRKPPVGFEDTIELVKSFLLGCHVDQHGTGCHHVNRVRLDHTQIVSGGAGKQASIKHPHLACKGSAMVEQVLGNIAKNHFSTLSNYRKSAKGNQAIATTHVEQCVAIGQPGVMQHFVPHQVQGLQHRFLLFGVTAMTPV